MFIVIIQHNTGAIFHLLDDMTLSCQPQNLKKLPDYILIIKFARGKIFS